MHYIGSVQDFVAAYPHPLGLVTAHVTCAPAAWAAHRHWGDNVLNGSILETAETLLWALCLGARAACEQPPTALARILGEPTFKTRAEDHGCKRHKWLWWWNRNLPAVTPSNVVPAEQIVDTLSASASHSKEVSMLLRSPIAPCVAAAHASAWDVGHDPWGAQKRRPAAATCEEYEEWREAMRHNYSIFAARYAPRLSAHQLAQTTQPRRWMVLVPVAHTGRGLATLAPLQGGAFGVEITLGGKLIEQATQAARCLGGGEPVMACAYPPREQSTLVFMVPTTRQSPT